MSKKPCQKKEAVIRGGGIRVCPFGLPVSEACCNVGKAIHRMAPIITVEDENKQEKLTKANNLVYIYHKEGKQCPFADKVLKAQNKVDCDFGDTGQGQHSAPWQGSPLYTQTFQGIGLDGLYGYPLGFYADNNESRNLFFGLFSFLGKRRVVNELVKLAYDCEEKDNPEMASKLDEILENITKTKNKEELAEKLRQLENMLREYRELYEEDRMDSGLLYELAEKWFGPRQVSK